MTEIYEAALQIIANGFTPVVLKNGEIILTCVDPLMDFTRAVEIAKKAEKLLNNPDTDRAELRSMFQTWEIYQKPDCTKLFHRIYAWHSIPD